MYLIQSLKRWFRQQRRSKGCETKVAFAGQIQPSSLSHDDWFLFEVFDGHPNLFQQRGIDLTVDDDSLMYGPHSNA